MSLNLSWACPISETRETYVAGPIIAPDRPIEKYVVSRLFIRIFYGKSALAGGRLLQAGGLEGRSRSIQAFLSALISGAAAEGGQRIVLAGEASPNPTSA
jgi:hypothetical protein